MTDEPQTTEKTAAWWEKQAGQYKAELDTLNPQLNQANETIVRLEQALSDARALAESKDATIGQLKQGVSDRDGMLAAAAQREQQHKQGLDAAAQHINELSNAIAALKARCAKQSAVLKQVANLTAPVMEALTSGLLDES